MIGLSQPVTLLGRGNGVTPEGGEVSINDRSPHPKNVIGVICSGNVAAYRDEVKRTIERGLAAHPEAVWVCVEAKSDRMTYDLLRSLGVDPVVLPLNPLWKIGRYDGRRLMRDREILRLCDEVIVFHKRAGHSPWRDWKKWGAQYDLYGHLYIVDLGPESKGKK